MSLDDSPVQPITYDEQLIEVAANFSDVMGRIEARYTNPYIIQSMSHTISGSWRLPRGRDSSIAVEFGVRAGFLALECTSPLQTGSTVKDEVTDLFKSRKATRRFGKTIATLCDNLYDTTSLHPELKALRDFVRTDPLQFDTTGVNFTQEQRRIGLAEGALRQTITVFDYVWHGQIS